MRNLSPCEKGNTHLTKFLGGISYKKFWRYNSSLPYVTARWPPQHIAPLNFLGLYPFPVSSMYGESYSLHKIQQNVFHTTQKKVVRQLKQSIVRGALIFKGGYDALHGLTKWTLNKYFQQLKNIP